MAFLLAHFHGFGDPVRPFASSDLSKDSVREPVFEPVFNGHLRIYDHLRAILFPDQLVHDLDQFRLTY